MKIIKNYSDTPPCFSVNHVTKCCKIIPNFIISNENIATNYKMLQYDT